MIRRIWWLPVGMLILLLFWYSPFHSSDTGPKTELPHFFSSIATQPPTQIQQIDHALLPYSIPGTDLIIETFLEYEGPYPEDLSDEEAIASALILRNNSAQTISFVRIEGTLAGQTLVFEGTWIPGNARVLIVEKERQLLQNAIPTKWTCPSLSVEELADWEKYFPVEISGSRSLSVTNNSGSSLPDLQIFYKQYDSKTDMYLGGITYCIVLPDMAPSETRTTSPYHFAQGYSQVVMIKPRN